MGLSNVSREGKVIWGRVVWKTCVDYGGWWFWGRGKTGGEWGRVVPVRKEGSSVVTRWNGAGRRGNNSPPLKGKVPRWKGRGGPGGVVKSAVSRRIMEAGKGVRVGAAMFWRGLEAHMEGEWNRAWVATGCGSARMAGGEDLKFGAAVAQHVLGCSRCSRVEGLALWRLAMGRSGLADVMGPLVKELGNGRKRRWSDGA